MGFHADRVDDGIRSSAVGEFPYGLGHVVLLVEVEHFDAVATCHLEPLGHEVDGR
jgi:hypothetical protein